MRNKFVIVGDIHISARNDSSIVMNHQLQFFENEVFPYMRKHKIKNLFTMGDLFDRRKYTNHVVLSEWKRRFFDVLVKMGVTFHTIIGNHDIPWANTLDANTPSLMLMEYDNIVVYDKPKTIQIGETLVSIVPWMCRENYNECMNEITKTKAQICFGHFDIAGFEMHKGHVSDDGIKREIFQRFNMVISGHFHARSNNGNIFYLGTPYELTWADVGDRRGFYVFDFDSLDLDFIENPVSIFSRLYWDDKDKGDNYYTTFDLKSLENTFVKVVVVNKTDPYQFEKFLDKLYNITLADLKIIEDTTDYDAESVDDDLIELEDTMSLMDSYIDGLDSIDFDRDKIKRIMKKLYTEALNMEV